MKIKEQFTLVLNRRGQSGLPEPIIAISDQRIVRTLARELSRTLGIDIGNREDAGETGRLRKSA